MFVTALATPQVKKQRRWGMWVPGPRGAVLVIMLLILALFSLIAVMWVARAALQRAAMQEYVDTLTARTAADAALEHAKAALFAARELPACVQSAWITLRSSAVEQVEYRVTLRDTGRLSQNELPWSTALAWRAAPVVPTTSGWRRLIDPCVASSDALRAACAAALRQCAEEETLAGELAASLADAYDDNLALGVQRDGSVGFEGFMLAGAWRGDDRLIPVTHVLRQSAFYDLDYQRDNFAIFDAFPIEAVEPVVDGAGRTNTRVRLAERLANPARQRQWEAFQHLWYQVYPARFIPHAWRGQEALIVTECGGASTRIRLLDNDDSWLYFEGYPIPACVRGRYVSIILCSLRKNPGCMTAEARGAVDVWFVTGLYADAAYDVQWSGDGRVVNPGVKLVYGAAARSAPARRVYAKNGVVGFEVLLSPEVRLSGVRFAQPEVVAWRYTGAQPLQPSGWQWERLMPEHLVDLLSIQSNAPARALVHPGALWLWSTDGMYPGSYRTVVSYVARDEAGQLFTVEDTCIEPSPHGGWAWRVRARVQQTHAWVDGEWRGALIVRAADSNCLDRAAFAVLDNTHNTLLVHAGTWATAEELAPARGSQLRIGGLVASLRRTKTRLRNPLGQVCAEMPPVPPTPPLCTWVQLNQGVWHAGAPRELEAVCPTGSPSARLAHSPVWQRLQATTRNPEAVAAVLDSWIVPHGSDLPVTAQQAPGSWLPTALTLRRTGEYRWRLPRLYGRWPRDFWRGAEVIFAETGERARVRRSSGTSLELDQRVQARSGSRATLAPVAGVVFHVSSGEAAEGSWEWTLPADVCPPCELYLRGFCPADTTTAARLHVALWNARTAAYDDVRAGTSFTQHDVLDAGVVGEEHLDSQRRLRLRVRARGGPIWIRGVYLVPAARAGHPPERFYGYQSAAAAVTVEARVRRHQLAAARARATALLWREWYGPQEHLVPFLRCVEWQWLVNGED
ncbi:MAG: pilus assembly PilX N-terminal domain-containing protein [bacterium]|nr:pilus assembly PilX N-terminal domain-containing protein [bacterium]